MHRLFVAIVPPAAIRDRLIAGMGGVVGARWQNDAQLHLTLRYIGEVDRHRAADVAAVLRHVRAPPFELALREAGSFDSRGRITSLWVGVGPREPVAALARRVDQALTAVGIAPETRDFLPHITVARFGRTAGSLAGYLGATPSSGAVFDVTGFTLFESLLGHEGSVYRAIEQYSIS